MKRKLTCILTLLCLVPAFAACAVKTPALPPGGGVSAVSRISATESDPGVESSAGEQTAAESDAVAESAASTGTATESRTGSSPSGIAGSSAGSDTIESTGSDTSPANSPAPSSSAPPEKKRPTCVFSVECSTVFDHLDDLDDGLYELLPPDGMIIPPCEVEFTEGETVFDVLERLCKEREIRLEFSFTPMYGSYYIEGINNLYEFSCGPLSGWMYAVDGVFPNFGCSSYKLKDGQRVEWRYTCDLGADVGGRAATGKGA